MTTPAPPLVYRLAQIDTALTRHATQMRMADLAGHADTAAYHEERIDALLEERTSLTKETP